ncbi:MAG: hypothetical protein ABIO80_09615 [Sphingomicrobium sp.]
MKKLAFALTGGALLTLGACNSHNEDQVNNVELNQPSADLLNEQANQAALDAANMAATVPPPASPPAADVKAPAPANSPSDDQEQNVSGM